MSDETIPDPTPFNDLGRALDISEENIEPEPSLSELIYDAICHADCYCKPGDPTCSDWRDSQHRWEAIHHSVMTTLDLYDTPKQSNLVDHARRELELIGEEADVIEWYLSVIRAFVSYGHSGGSAFATIPVINELLQYKNLRPLTNDPDEWVHHTEEVWPEPGGIWQNKRNGEAFSDDGGKTYTLLSEKQLDPDCVPIHISADKVNFSPEGENASTKEG